MEVWPGRPFPLGATPSKGGVNFAVASELADSVILATARHFDATVWTQDADFEGLPNVRYRPKHSGGCERSK